MNGTEELRAAKIATTEAPTWVARGLSNSPMIQQQQEATPTHAQKIPTCERCGKRGHLVKACYRRLGLCLVCGSSQHRRRNCPEQHSTTPIIQKQAHPAQGGPMSCPQAQQQQKAAPYKVRGGNPICKSCKMRGHIQKDCPCRLGLCTTRGSKQHHAKDCSKQRDATKMVERPGPDSSVAYVKDEEILSTG